MFHPSGGLRPGAFGVRKQPAAQPGRRAAGARSVRLLPVRPGTDLDEQRHGEFRDVAHEIGQRRADALEYDVRQKAQEVRERPRPAPAPSQQRRQPKPGETLADQVQDVLGSSVARQVTREVVRGIFGMLRRR